MAALEGPGKRLRIEPGVVDDIGQRFREHAEELAPHAALLQGMELASAYGPWSDAAGPLEEQVRRIGESLGRWAGYCDGYGKALRESVAEYSRRDEEQGQRLRDVDVSHGDR